MMPTGARVRRTAVVITQLLVLVILAISPQAGHSPKTACTKAKDCTRPKAPKDVVRTEPLRISSLDKQTTTPKDGHLDSGYPGLEEGRRSTSVADTLLRRAFTQLTKPDYLNFSTGSPPVPFGPPV